MDSSTGNVHTNGLAGHVVDISISGILRIPSAYGVASYQSGMAN